MSMWDKFWQEDTHCPKIFGLRNLEKCRKAMGVRCMLPRGGSSHYTFRKAGCQPITIRMEIVEDQEEGGCVVSFPDLPGCITCGVTMERAVVNAADAKKAFTALLRSTQNGKGSA